MLSKELKRERKSFVVMDPAFLGRIIKIVDACTVHREFFLITGFLDNHNLCTIFVFLSILESG